MHVFGIPIVVNIQSRYTAVLIEVTAHLVMDTSTTTSHKPLRTPATWLGNNTHMSGY